jgi:hypothetical protein
MNERRRTLWLAAAAGHLCLVTLGASTFSLRELGLPGRVLDEYGALSGANSGYGFFAPGVTSQLGARFDVIDAEGRTTSASLADGESHEADLRVGNIIDQFSHIDDDEDEESADHVRRSLAASLAGKMFARHPEASAVVVRLELFTPVSMDAWRGGERPRWMPHYSAKFVHLARPEPGSESDEESDDG